MPRIWSSSGQASTGGGGGTTVNLASGIVDFGFPNGFEGDTATVTVSATWVTAASTILCSVKADATPDHSGDDALVDGLQAYAQNIVPGVGFTINAIALNNTWGRYNVQAISIG